VVAIGINNRTVRVFINYIRGTQYVLTNHYLFSLKIPRIFWNPKVYYRVYKSPTPVHIVSQINSGHAPSCDFEGYILIISSSLFLGFPNNFSPSGSLTKTLYEPQLSQYVLHALTISLYLISFSRVIFDEE